MKGKTSFLACWFWDFLDGYSVVPDAIQAKRHIAQLKRVLTCGYRSIVLECLQYGDSRVLVKTLGKKGVPIKWVFDCIKKHAFVVSV